MAIFIQRKRFFDENCEFGQKRLAKLALETTISVNAFFTFLAKNGPFDFENKWKNKNGSNVLTIGL